MEIFNISNLTKEQLQVVSDALDLYARIGTGQFYKIAEPFGLPADFCWKHKGEENYQTNIKHAENYLNLAANALMDCPEFGHGSYSIGNEKVDEKVRIAYDIHQVIRNKIDNSSKIYQSAKAQLIKVEIGLE